jgi:hypothetical protein
VCVGARMWVVKPACVFVDAPHPQVWEEINNEHCKRGDSNIEFNPGNYSMITTSKLEFMIAIDTDEGKKASIGKR